MSFFYILQKVFLHITKRDKKAGINSKAKFLPLVKIYQLAYIYAHKSEMVFNSANMWQPLKNCDEAAFDII